MENPNPIQPTPPVVNGDKQWYVVSAYASHENKVADNLRRRVNSMNMENYIFRILVVEQEEAVFKNGAPTGKKKMRNAYPGYVFIEMIMTDDSWYVCGIPQG